MALLECLDCGYPVSSSAAKCPQCGRVDPTSNTWSEIIFTIARYAVKLVKRILSATSGSKSESRKSFGAEGALPDSSLDAEYRLYVTTHDLTTGCERTLNCNGKNYTVKIPAGSKPGARLRMQGLGNQVTRDGRVRKGDLYLLLCLKDD